MKVSTILTATVIALLSSSAFAANSIKRYESAIAAETIVRQVISARLLTGEDKVFNASLKRALEGSGRSNQFVTITSIKCERALSADQCVIGFTSEDTSASSDGEVSYFELSTSTYQGKVQFAKITGFAG